MQIVRVRKDGYNVEFVCDYCGFIGIQRLSHYKRKKRHFCSQSCYSRFRAELLPKEEQHAYGSGLPEEERKKRRKARSDANHAIRDRKIKPKPCFICGQKAEMHHPNYDQSLKVEWYCKKHHWEIYENPELLEKD